MQCISALWSSGGIRFCHWETESMKPAALYSHMDKLYVHDLFLVHFAVSMHGMC